MKKKLEKADISKLAALLEAKDTEGAKALLVEFLGAKLSSVEQGEVSTNLIAAGLEVQNKIDHAYLNELREVIATVKAINTTEANVNEKLNLAKVRANLR